MNFGERVLLYEIVSRICKNIGCPFAVGVSATSLEDVTALAMKGVEVGCDGIMLGLPPYLRLCQEEIIHYVESVRSVVPHRIPILLYNNVTRNSYGASAETLVYLHQQGIIWGVKHASPEFAQDCDNLFGLDPSIKLYTGSDVLIKNLMTIGDHKFYGLTSILGNIFPTELAEMIADFVFSDGEDTGLVSHKNMTRRQVLLQELSDAILLGCTLPVGVKYALKLRGVPGGDSRRPIGFLSDSKKLEIEIQVNKFLEFTTSET